MRWEKTLNVREMARLWHYMTDVRTKLQQREAIKCAIHMESLNVKPFALIWIPLLIRWSQYGQKFNATTHYPCASGKTLHEAKAHPVQLPFCELMQCVRWGNISWHVVNCHMPETLLLEKKKKKNDDQQSNCSIDCWISRWIVSVIDNRLSKLFLSCLYWDSDW